MVNQASICQICLDIPRNRIYQCEDGHIICDECKRLFLVQPDDEKPCPTCKVNTDFSIKNIALEKISERMLLSCKYKLNGCIHKSIKATRLEHEKDCSFCPKCPFPGCDHRIDYEDPKSIMKHIEQCRCYRWSAFWSELDTWSSLKSITFPRQNFIDESWACGIPLKSESGMYLLRIKYNAKIKTIRFCAFRIFSLPGHNDDFLYVRSSTETACHTIPVFIRDVKPYLEELRYNFRDFEFNCHSSFDTVVPSLVFNCANFSITKPKNYTRPRNRTNRIISHIEFEFESNVILDTSSGSEQGLEANSDSDSS